MSTCDICKQPLAADFSDAELIYDLRDGAPFLVHANHEPPRLRRPIRVSGKSLAVSALHPLVNYLRQASAPPPRKDENPVSIEAAFAAALPLIENLTSGPWPDDAPDPLQARPRVGLAAPFRCDLDRLPIEPDSLGQVTYNPETVVLSHRSDTPAMIDPQHIELGALRASPLHALAAIVAAQESPYTSALAFALKIAEQTA